MESDLMKQIMEQVDKALPSIQATSFRKYLDEAQKTEARLDETLKMTETLKAQVRSLQTTVLQLESYRDRIRDLEAGEKKLRDEKFEFERTKLAKEAELVMYQKMYATVQCNFDTVFRNTVSRETVQRMVPIFQEYGKSGMFTHESEDTAVTKVKE